MDFSQVLRGMKVNKFGDDIDEEPATIDSQCYSPKSGSKLLREGRHRMQKSVTRGVTAQDIDLNSGNEGGGVNANNRKSDMRELHKRRTSNISFDDVPEGNSQDRLPAGYLDYDDGDVEEIVDDVTGERKSVRKSKPNM